MSPDAHGTPLRLGGRARQRGVEPGECNQIVKRLLPKYETRLADPPAGKKFQECYDVEAIEPCAEYVDLCGKVKEELNGGSVKLTS